ncbi:hypothetical protein [Pseudomonas sp. B20]|uniref:hypothetical protein n=1 Tax=Pseudomonas sp. B20 TaxID=129268 RepID=UPI001CF9390A|nr:hypothetical protein [Pseudomonas sp. B20]
MYFASERRHHMPKIDKNAYKLKSNSGFTERPLLADYCLSRRAANDPGGVKTTALENTALKTGKKCSLEHLDSAVLPVLPSLVTFLHTLYPKRSLKAA